jgi:hypothetical protein
MMAASELPQAGLLANYRRRAYCERIALGRAHPSFSGGDGGGEVP